MATYVRTVNVVSSVGQPPLNTTMTGTPAGNLLVATWQAYWNTAGTSNLSSITGGGTWTFPSTANQQNPPSAFAAVNPSPWVALCGIAWVVATSANPVVTLTFSRSISSLWWRVNEFSSPAVGTFMRAAAAAPGAGSATTLITSVTTPTIAAQPGDACLAATAGAAGFSAVGAPWNRPNQSGSGNLAVIDQAYLVPSAAGNIAATFTGSSQATGGGVICAIGPPGHWTDAEPQGWDGTQWQDALIWDGTTWR